MFGGGGGVGNKIVPTKDGFEDRWKIKSSKSPSGYIQKYTEHRGLVDMEFDTKEEAQYYLDNYIYENGGGVEGMGVIEKFFELDNKYSKNAQKGELVYVHKQYRNDKLFLHRILLIMIPTTKHPEYYSYQDIPYRIYKSIF